ncbi:MAG: AAA family ATPase [Magnetococcales bacterium]|nr:AAA family ATPase [Magnetococcales bacterium]
MSDDGVRPPASPDGGGSAPPAAAGPSSKRSGEVAKGGGVVSELSVTAQQREAYLDFLGLKRNPFPVSPDIENFFLPSRLDSLITEILHSIHTRKGFMVITGEVGLGKTTISRRLLRILDEGGVATALIFNTYFQGSELLDEIIRDFGIGSGLPVRPQERMTALNDFLIEQYRAGVNCAIVIDDAQNLNRESLELIRMISNLEANAEKLVQILLVGQTELEESLNAHELRQLKSRIVVHARVVPFDRDELKQYVFFRLNASGAHGNLTITDGAFRLAQELTEGNPRLVNKLFERCLYGLFAYNSTRLTARLIKEVAPEVGMTRPPVPWRRLALRFGLPVAGAALATGVVAALLGGYAPWSAPRFASEEEARAEIARAQEAREGADAARVEAEALQEKAKAEVARAEAARKQVESELAAARSAREKAQAEVARAKAEREKTREEVAQAQMAEAKALTLVAQAKAGTAEDARRQGDLLAQSRLARQSAEAAATQAETALANAMAMAEEQEKALEEARTNGEKLEKEAVQARAELAAIQEKLAAEQQALKEAREAREKALAEAEESRRRAETEAAAADARIKEAEEEARRKAEESERQTEALAAAKKGRETAEVELVRAKAEAAEALRLAEASRDRALEEASAAKKDAERLLAEARDSLKRSEEAAAQAREEAAKKVAEAVEEGRRLAAREGGDKAKAVEAARLLEEKAREEAREVESRVRAELEKSQGKVKEAKAGLEVQTASLAEARQARDEAVKEAAKARAEAEKAMSEANQARSDLEAIKAKLKAGGGGAGGGVTVPPEVKAFLAAYGLGEHEGGFAAALEQGWLGQMADRVGSQTGWRLVILPQAFAGELKGAGVLVHPRAGGAGSDHLLFWKAPYWIDTFYFGSVSPVVRRLQEDLRQAGYYEAEVDGIVGRHTLRGLTRFQKASNLPLTGMPDAATLYLLQRAKGRAATVAGSRGQVPQQVGDVAPGGESGGKPSSGT